MLPRSGLLLLLCCPAVITQEPVVATDSHGIRGTAQSEVDPQCYEGDAPFHYSGPQGDAARVRDPATGLCIYPNTTCSPSLSLQCNCGPERWVDYGAETANDFFLLLGLGIATGLGVLKCIVKVAWDQQRTEHDGAQWAIFGALASLLAIQNVLTASATLTLAEHAALMSAHALLVPFSSIFLCFEDVLFMTIGFLAGIRDPRGVGTVVLASAALGLVCGVLAAGLFTGFAAWEAAFEFLLAPTLFQVPGCEGLPTTAEILTEAKPYWLLTVWSWPISFMANTFSGFLLGTGKGGSWGLATVMAKIVFLVVVRSSQHHLTLKRLGLATLADAIVTLLMTLIPVVAIFWERRHARSHSSFDPEVNRPKVVRVLAGNLCRGIVLNGCVQLGLILGTYAAAHKGPGPFYQVTLLQFVMPYYGRTWTLGLEKFIKMNAAPHVGQQHFHEFRDFILDQNKAAVVTTALSVIVLMTCSQQIAYSLSKASCAFATQAACVPAYIAMYGNGVMDGNSLPEAFTSFIFAVVALSFFQVAKVGLYSSLDIVFMARAAVAIFVILFVPITLGSIIWLKTATAIYIAMYFPVIVLAFFLMVKLLINVEAMIDGRAGPWLECTELLTGLSPRRSLDIGARDVEEVRQPRPLQLQLERPG